MLSTLNTKIFCAEAKYTLAEFGCTRQFPSEDLNLYVRKFQEKALDCCDLIDEDVLVNVFLHDMNNEYGVFLKNLSVPLFYS